LLYTLAPLEKHSDDGFGAVGEAFKKAADTLLESEESKQRMLWSELPVVFLLRHAIELFLKSGVIVVHRKLKLSYGSEGYKSKNPLIPTPGGAWKPLSRTHDISQLYSYWKKLISNNKDALTKLASHKSDMSVPDELDAWIAVVAKIDPSSDYFRYPTSKNRTSDKEKSAFKEVPIESLFPAGRKEGEYVKAMVLEDADGNLVRAFKHDNSTNRDTEQAAWKAADMLSNFHIMLRVVLMDGW
jgi:hypothetical protein